VFTTLSYDQRGRKIGMNDPAMGVWSYGYNAFCELVRQTDSLGQVSTMGYDALGRMTTKNEPDLKSTWFFDRDASGQACGKSVGKLCEARADNGYKRLRSFDSLGRANSTRTAQDSSQALSSVSVGFDANTGRMNSQTWPTGYYASYGYSTLGYLQTVNGSGSGMPGTQLDNLKYDSQGRLTGYRQGGRITTVKEFDQATGRLKDIQAQVDGQAAGSVFKQTYSYDSLSNLTAKSDANTGVQESYSYDSLNRLRTYTSLGGSVSPPTSTQVVYDARGNIIYKSDVGRYWYDSQRPNRLANITLEGYAGAQALTGTRALSYVFDDYGSTAKSNGSVAMGNGNLMYTVSHDNASGKHTVRRESYTSFNMPLEIKYGNIGAAQNSPAGFTSDRTLSFAYGPEYQRVKQVVTLSGNAPSQMMGGTTWYLHGDNNSLLFEREVKASGITEQQHFLQAAGMTFALVVTRTGSGISGANADRNMRPAQSEYFQRDYLGSIAKYRPEFPAKGFATFDEARA
jgi:YD repeat-containing protein